MPFHDRAEAGRSLASRIRERLPPDTVLLALAPGGVAVALELARELSLPLDLALTAPIADPGCPTLALGAMGEQGVEELDWSLCRALRIGPHALRRALAHAANGLSYHRRCYQPFRPRIDLTGRPALVVDEGLDSPWPLLAALASARARGALEVSAAVPVASEAAAADFRTRAPLIVVEEHTRLRDSRTWYDLADTPAEEAVIAALTGAGAF